MARTRGVNLGHLTVQVDNIDEKVTSLEEQVSTNIRADIKKLQYQLYFNFLILTGIVAGVLYGFLTY